MESKIAKTNGQITKQIPKYEDLINYVDAKENNFQVLLNQEPPSAWVQVNKIANNSKYLPIDKIEYLLTRIFINWRVEVLSFKIIANSVAVHIRLHYQSPVSGEWLYQDGLGAAPMQTNSGYGATDFNNIKSAAVQMALPSAETYAIKDAAEKIGRLFGKDLNRKDLMNYADLIDRIQDTDEVLTIASKLKNLHTEDELDSYMTQLRKSGTKITSTITKIFATRINEINGIR
jgi:hypothetical protein